MATYLCQVVDRTAEGIEPNMIVLGSEPMSWDNMARWSILYRCLYGSGHSDAELHQQDLIAATGAGAIERLQRRMIGFDVEAIEIFAIQPPLTREQVAAVHAANEEIEAERQRLGIFGEGPQREKAIEQWLTTGK